MRPATTHFEQISLAAVKKIAARTLKAPRLGVGGHGHAARKTSDGAGDVTVPGLRAARPRHLPDRGVK